MQGSSRREAVDPSGSLEVRWANRTGPAVIAAKNSEGGRGSGGGVHGGEEERGFQTRVTIARTMVCPKDAKPRPPPESLLAARTNTVCKNAESPAGEDACPTHAVPMLHKADINQASCGALRVNAARMPKYIQNRRDPPPIPHITTHLCPAVCWHCSMYPSSSPPPSACWLLTPVTVIF